ncbi:MAG TPA: response regulator transcription factor [Thermomicrobiaceae bacterium]|nr:response regulator transcription factor [Thermomicrobiaceae bacterium]
MSRILIIEDDQHIAELIRLYLHREGHDVVLAGDGREGLRLFGEDEPDLVLLDLMLPGLHGRDVCRAIRTRSAAPVLMLTALDDERDVVAGLDLGADDYITKPFKPRELVARVRAALRRSGGLSTVAREVVVGDLVLDTQAREAHIGGQSVELRAKEFDLLLALAAHPRVVFTREQLLQQVWGRDYDVDTRTVDVHVNRLRTRLAGSSAEIETVRGVGYRLTSSGDAPEPV